MKLISYNLTYYSNLVCYNFSINSAIFVELFIEGVYVQNFLNKDAVFWIFSGPNGYTGGKVVFIDTENTFRPDRLRPIADRFNLDQVYKTSLLLLLIFL